MALLRDLFARKARERSWVYVLVALVLGFYVLLGHDETFATLWHLYILIGLCAVQLFYPTILAWALLFVPLLAYALSILVMRQRGPLNEYVFFLALSVVPPVSLFLARPRRALRAVVVALVVGVAAVVVVGRFFA